MNTYLNALLNPQSVVVVGASSQPGKVGYIVLKQVLGGKYRVYGVNPRGGEACGIPLCRSLQELPEAPDLAVLALPAEATLGAASECIRLGVRAIVAVASGFGEAGEQGRAMEKQLGTYLEGTPTRLLGPNTVGVLVPRTGLDTVFLPIERLRRPASGSVAFISQSGSVGMGELDLESFFGASLSAFVGLGNRLDIDENELLHYYADDPNTSVIAMYLESFADPRKFLEACRRIVPHKPIVLLKAGRSSAGAHAVQLHTGSLAGSDRVTDGTLRQVGVLRTFDPSELLDTAKALACIGSLPGRRVAVLTNGGGWGIISADFIEARERGIGASLASLSPETQSALRKVALPFAAVHNPVDLTAAQTNEMCAAALEILQDDPQVDVILCIMGYQPPAADPALTDILCHWGKHGKKPLVAVMVGSDLMFEALRQLNSAGIAAYPNIWRAVRAIDALARRGDYLRQLDVTKSAESTPRIAPQPLPVRPGTPLAEDQAKALLAEFGVQTPPSVVLAAGATLPDIQLNYPLVVKVRSAAILHKTELGGVMLRIPDRLSLDRAILQMRERFPGEDLLIEEMVASGVELIVGLVQDATFGTSLLVGGGGVLAELYQDVTFRSLPISRRDAQEMLQELKAGALLRGFRGIQASQEAVVDLLLNVSRLGMAYEGQINQMDLNPVIVHPERAVVVDAKLLWNSEKK